MMVRRVLLGVMAVGLAAALFVVAQRSARLSAGPGVELALSLQAARESSVTQAEPFDEILAVYREAGVTSLLIGGTTLQELMDFGGTGYPADYRVWVWVAPGALTDQSVVAVRENPALAEWLQARLAARLGRDRVTVVPAEPGLVYIAVQGPTLDQLKRLDLGLHPADLALADRLGWRPALHLSEPAGLPPAVAPELLLEGLPPGAPVLLTGAGLPASGASAMAALLAQGNHPLLLDHAQPPFSEGMPPGVGAVSAETGHRAIKLFRVTFHHAVADVVTAVKERQMRYLLVQPFHLSGDLKADLARQGAQWAEVGVRLREAGLTLGAAEPVRGFAPPPWARFLAGAAVGAGAGLLLGGWGGLAVALMLVGLGGVAGLAPVLVPGGALAALGPAPLEILVLQLLGLACAAVVPAAGAVVASSRTRLAERLAWVAGAGFAAGLLLTALLGDVRFMLELALFRGIKVALVAPAVLLVASLVWNERQTLLGALRQPLRAWHIGVAAVGLLALALMLARSGQESSLLLVSEWELRLRHLLEQVLVARPRFKEFLVGWPLIVLAHLALAANRRALGLVLLSAGMMAPASLVNSFAHLHTPVWLSALRSLHGLWLGVLLGGALAWLWWRRGGARHAA